MRLAVADLKALSRAARSLGTSQAAKLSAMMRRRQPGFCSMVDFVRTDPRCRNAYSFCVFFCALAFKHAEDTAGHRLPQCPESSFRTAAGWMAQGCDAALGQNSQGCRERIRRHVLPRATFDEDDTEWLCTTISAFLFVVTRSARVLPRAAPGTPRRLRACEETPHKL